MKEQVQEVINRSTVEGSVLRLPNEQLDRKLYVAVNKHLQFIGGKWKGGKVQGFTFPEGVNVPELVGMLSDAGTDVKKTTQFFETPDNVVGFMIGNAAILPGTRILEPSAGRGAIVKEIRKRYQDDVTIDVFELDDINRKFLSIQNMVDNDLGKDFMLRMPTEEEQYDYIVANPPFRNNQDIEHIMRMWLWLKKGGTMVTLSSTHWTFANDKLSKAFRQWLDDNYADVSRIDAGAFKDSGTMIETCMIVITK